MPEEFLETGGGAMKGFLGACHLHLPHFLGGQTPPQRWRRLVGVNALAPSLLPP